MEVSEFEREETASWKEGRSALLFVTECRMTWQPEPGEQELLGDRLELLLSVQ